MAQLIVEGDELVLRLSALERAEAVHGDVRVPRAAITAVEVVDHALREVHGVRVGTGVPGLTAVGTFTSRDVRMFAVVHHDTPRGVLVTLKDASFDQVLVGCADPESVAASLSASR